MIFTALECSSSESFMWLRMSSLRVCEGGRDACRGSEDVRDACTGSEGVRGEMCGNNSEGDRYE